MPSVSKHLRPSKRRVMGTSSRAERKDEQRSKKKKLNKPSTGSNGALSLVDESLALPEAGELAPAASEDFLGDESDVDVQNFIRCGRNLSEQNYCLVDYTNSAFVCRSRNSGNKLSFVDFLLCMIIALMCMYVYVLLEQVISRELVSP